MMTRYVIVQNGAVVTVFGGPQPVDTAGYEELAETDALWVAYLLAQAQASQTVILKTACDAAITGGFSAAALGAAYTYPSAATDQANLAQTAAAAGGGMLMCESAANVWSLVAHTQTQAQTVLAAFIAWRDKQRQQLATLIAEVAAAATPALVAAIVWP